MHINYEGTGITFSEIISVKCHHRNRVTVGSGDRWLFAHKLIPETRFNLAHDPLVEQREKTYIRQYVEL